MDDSESGGVYAAEKIIRKRYKKVKENVRKQSTKIPVHFICSIRSNREYQIKYKIEIKVNASCNEIVM